jgi:CHAT domain-containing protein/tetratricopeptide (TPR) repeat protein
MPRDHVAGAPPSLSGIAKTAATLCVGMVALLWIPGAAQTQSDRRADATNSGVLTVGGGVERTLSAGQSHFYQVTLAVGDLLHATIEQRGIDVTATLKTPNAADGMTIDAMDDEFRPETVVLIADTDGTYTLAIRPSSSARTDGRYVIRVDAIRPAADDDNIRVSAERAFVTGRKTRSPSASATWPEALAEFEKALGAYRQLSDRAGEMKTLLEIGITHYYLSRAEALASARAAERLARELGDWPAVARALRSAGNTLVLRGEFTDAIVAFEESSVISHKSGHRNAEARSLNDGAIALRRTGDVERAVVLYERALPLARATNDQAIEANILNNLGVAYKNLADYDRAAAFYEQSVANRRAANDEKGLYYGLGNLGTLALLQGDYPRALDLAHQVLAIARRIGDKLFEAGALEDIGLVTYARGDYAAALTIHQESLEIRRKLGSISGAAWSLQNVGRTLHRLGRDAEALAALQEGLTIYRNIREQLGERDALGNLAAIEGDRGNLAEAVRYIQASVDLDEALRGRITSPQLRGSFVAGEQDKYQLFIDLLQRQHAADPSAGHDVRALEISERSRARVLLDSLLDGQVDLREGVQPALLERERTLQRQLSEASVQLSQVLARGAPEKERIAASDLVQRTTNAFQELQAEIRRHSPHYAAVTQPQPLATAVIQREVLDSDTVLLEFALGADKSWLWAVTPDAIVSRELPARPKIEAIVRSLYDGVTARHRRPGERTLDYTKRIATADARLDRDRAALSEMLLGGIAVQFQNQWRDKRLAIVATGVLEYVPFGALPIPAPSTDAAGRPSRPSPSPSLAARHEIVHIPSASVLAALRREIAARPPANRAVAILADPVFQLADPRVHAASRAVQMTEDRLPYQPTRHVTRLAERGELGRLPFSREEAAAIASLVPTADVFKATDFAANRSTVLRGRVTGHRVVHFATHGVFDAGSPALSGLVLSLVNERGESQDGFLRLNDIYNLKLDADLVVLSACQTALGKEIRGEGLVGLTRAFMYAGAPRVVASLWQVSDYATAELMKKFYRGVLTDGLRPSTALRAAQLEMSKDPRWKSPYYWAGFILQGDWQ